MTDPEIDTQLNTRARAPHYDAVNAAYAALSDAARSRLALASDLSYGPHPLERIDILRPQKPLRGVMVWYHGGFWRTRDKHDFHFLASGYARLGLATIAVGYPKCPDVSLGRIAEAGVAALDMTLARAGEWGFEAMPIFVGGHSAGAHLATLAVLARPDRVAGLVAVSGLYDLAPVKRSFANAHLDLSDADVAALSPIAHPAADAPPAVFLSGEDETAEFHRQAGAMAGAWNSAGASAVAATARAADHYTILFALSADAIRPSRPCSTGDEMTAASKTTLIKNASWVVAYDASLDSHVYLRDADVAFRDDTLIHVGPAFADVADVVIDAADKAVFPGLVNVHGHLGTEALGKGFFEDLGNHDQYMSRLYEYIYVVRPPDAEARRAVTRTTIAELLRSGCTTMADMSLPYDGWISTFAETGVRAYLTPMFKSAAWSMSNGHRVDYVWDEAAGKRDFLQALTVIDEARAEGRGLLDGIVMPAQVDTCTPDLLVSAYAAALDRGLPYQIHSGQSVLEFHEMIRRHGKTATAYLRDLGVLGHATTIAHSLFIDRHPWLSWHQDEDIHILAETGTSVAHCPVTFAYRGAAMNDFGTYRKAGINMSLGTDTYPHNMAEEMRIALFLAKAARRHVDHTRTEDVFTAATLGGARALGRNDIGRLSIGAKADLFLLDLTHPAMRPCRDPLRSYVYSAGDRAVTDVFVAGRQLVSNRELTSIDLDQALATLDLSHARAMSDVSTRDWASRSAEMISPLSLAVRGAGKNDHGSTRPAATGL